MGSNGLTSARHDVFAKHLAQKFPESYDQNMPSELVYSGKYDLLDKIEGLDVNMGQLVLSPTRTYAPIITRILKECRSAVGGMIHCTGGGQTKVLHFVDNMHIIKDNLFPTPPLFKIIQEQSQTPMQDMYKVFNMGHRMELYVEPEAAQEIIDISKSFNVDAQIIGRVEKSDTKKLTINNEFNY